MKLARSLAGLLFLVASIHAYPVSDELLAKINLSKRALDAETALITQEKIGYSKRIDELREELNQLKNQAENIQRAEDEKTISLDSLQARLKRWQDQLGYQEYLLNDLSNLLDEQASAENPERIISESLARLNLALSPEWSNNEIALRSGEIVNVKAMKVGPVNLYYDDDQSIAGLFKVEPRKQNESHFEYSVGETNDVAGLYEQKLGFITFDATQGSAFEILASQESLLGHLKKGGIWVFPIIFFGVVSLIASGLKCKQVLQIPSYSGELIAELERAMSRRDSDQLASIETLINQPDDPLRQLATAIVSENHDEKRDAELVNIMGTYKHQIEKHLDLISMVAAVAPLLGLLGTVSGMIQTFKMLTIFGSGDPSAISGGISEALVTTELGLIVAIPSLLINALLSRKIKSHLGTIDRQVMRFDAISRAG